MELFQKKIVSSFNLKIGREYPSIVFKIRSIVFKINLYKISCERSIKIILLFLFLFFVQYCHYGPATTQQ